MPECPNCGSQISYLINQQKVREEYEIYEFDGEYRLIDRETIPADGSTYHCPECGIELFNSEDNAINFLRGIPQTSGQRPEAGKG